MMLFILAWRNIWRNRRRTLITLASVFFAVVLSTLLMSIKEGMYARMIDSMAGTWMGYVQVHSKGYWDERTLEYSFEPDAALVRNLLRFSGVDTLLPRVECGVLTAAGERTHVAMLTGFDPGLEAGRHHLDRQVIAGKFLEEGDRAVLAGEGLARYLKIVPGDTLVLIGQGYHESSAAGKYPVKGILRFGSPELSKQLVFLPLKEAQELLSMQGRLSSWVMTFRNPLGEKLHQKEMTQAAGPGYEVMHWTEMMPELNDLIKTDRVEGYVYMFILYLVVSFGILGTLVMMLAERRHEFGVLVAIGMKRIRLALVVVVEVIMISLLGAVAGMAGAWPICWYFHVYPFPLGKEFEKMTEEFGMEAVIQSSIDPSVFIQQGLVVLGIASLLSLWPFIKILRMNALQSMRN